MCVVISAETELSIASIPCLPLQSRGCCSDQHGGCLNREFSNVSQRRKCLKRPPARIAKEFIFRALIICGRTAKHWYLQRVVMGLCFEAEDRSVGLPFVARERPDYPRPRDSGRLIGLRWQREEIRDD